MDGPASRWHGHGPRLSIGSPSRLNTRPRVSLPTGTVSGRAGIDAIHAAAKAVGAAQRHRPHPAAAQVLLHFADQVHRDAVVGAVDGDGVVDLGKLVLGELGVEGRADDLGDFSDSGHEPVLVKSAGIVQILHNVASY